MEIKTQGSGIKRQKFTKSDERFLSLLEADGCLSDIVHILRSKMNIPRNGITIEPNTIGDNIKTIRTGQLWHASDYLLSLYQLPPSWRVTMMSILLFSVAVPPVHIDSRLYKRGDTYIALEHEVHLVISERVTRTDLRDYFKLHPEIDKDLEVLPEPVKISKHKIIGLGKQIYELKRMGKTSGEILELLPHGKIDDNLDHSTIGVYLHRYLKAIRQHITIDPRHRVLKAIEL